MSDGGGEQIQEVQNLIELEEEEEKEVKPKLELPFPFEKELYDKQCKRIFIVEKFVPTERESHNIGWPSLDAQYLNKNVNRILAPKLRCDLTVFGEALGKERVTERPEFSGEKFFLR
ncbi:uncharacterized protein LOC129614412 [Condylostylus longicornis]|uniref:uncharacterized protein LOC129614412 n=1 Tax=Condylostylus longicornis TaxID=2530218 RepID=UPI00244E58F0|nr:uncharacterized protein LOC129614412 [Condylostylus longicornis]